MKKPLFLIMAGDGINCERETARAIELSGGAAKIMHVNDILSAPESLKTADGLAVPGGFSFGDELGSGQILALKIRHGLGEAFFNMVRQKKPVIGICNGFQVLVKLGLLPFPDAPERVLALAANESGKFLDRWVEMDVKDSVCLWTQGLAQKKIRLPMRHGEGRIVFKDEATYDVLLKQGQIPLVYTEDVNGSYKRIAALTDPTGVVLGLMPHPEAFVYQATAAAPQADTMAKGDGALIFDNIMKILQGKENARRFG
jgi:phosphoribosylformylglycinamidine synthase I